MTSVFVDSRWVGGAKAAAAWLMSGWTPSRAPVVGERRQEAERPAIERIRNLIGWRRSQNLVGRRYGQRGLRVGPAGSPEPGLTTLEAHDGRRLVGTLSVRMDGPDGLAADASFPEELLALRAKGRRLCEFTRFAMDMENSSKHALASLFHLAHLVAHHIKQADLLVMEVHPRHAPFYRRMLGARRLQVGQNETVQAPSVLLCLDLKFGQEQIRKFGGRPELAEEVRSLYPYFHAPSEEPALIERLRAEA
ncbi:long-chain N-acyl amino acid synthase [Inhella sp.]|uniref:N-acyl amino acid synthase FeeM domain-containing protein n=1 Tax=Inhella sp. TaxID=1921806 RepID=UPI0035B49DB6